MSELSGRLAVELADRLSGVLPSPVTIRAAAGRLEVFAEESLLGISDAPRILADEDGRSTRERLEVAARAALGAVQDLVAVYLGEPWPRSADGEMGLPGVRVVEGRISAWYGPDEAEAVLALPPIEIGDWIG